MVNVTTNVSINASLTIIQYKTYTGECERVLSAHSFTST